MNRRGNVLEVDGAGTFRAHVQYRDAARKKTHITGPKRDDREEAEADLVAMRRAAGVFASNREMALKSMAAEATRLKLTAEDRRRRRLTRSIWNCGESTIGMSPRV